MMNLGEWHCPTIMNQSWSWGSQRVDKKMIGFYGTFALFYSLCLLLFWISPKETLKHSVHWGINPMSKTPPPSFSPSPLLNLKVMIEKNIFVYKHFSSLNISDFVFFLCKNCNPLEKSHPLFPSNIPLKIEILLSPPFSKFRRRFNPK